MNGQPGWTVLAADGSARSVLTVDVVGGRIAAVRIVRNPDKLRHVARSARTSVSRATASPSSV